MVACRAIVVDIAWRTATGHSHRYMPGVVLKFVFEVSKILLGVALRRCGCAASSSGKYFVH